MNSVTIHSTPRPSITPMNGGRCVIGLEDRHEEQCANPKDEHQIPLPVRDFGTMVAIGLHAIGTFHITLQRAAHPQQRQKHAHQAGHEQLSR